MGHDLLQIWREEIRVKVKMYLYKNLRKLEYKINNLNH